MATLDGLFSLYFGGDLDAAFAFGGQVAGRIDAVQTGRADHRGDDGGVPRHDPRARGAVPVNDRLPALDGLRVLELAEGIAGAYAGKLLRDQGAEVVKVERADGDDPLRRWSAATPDAPVDGTGALFAFLNGGKRERHRRRCRADAVGRRRHRRRRYRRAVDDQRRHHRAVRCRRAVRRHARVGVHVAGVVRAHVGVRDGRDPAVADGHRARSVGGGRGRGDERARRGTPRPTHRYRPRGRGRARSR